MPITLTTPIDTGDLDGVLNKVRIAHFEVQVARRTIRMQVQYGKMVNDVWQPTPARVNRQRNFRINEAEFDALVASSTSSASGELVYDLVSKNLYQWLIDNDHVVGTIDT